MKDQVSLSDLGLEEADNNHIFIELMALNMFITINLFSNWVKDECIRNGILDGMHTAYYLTLKNGGKTDEDMKQLKDFLSQRYGQYGTITISHDNKEWLKELAKMALNYLHEGTYEDITALLSMVTYISGQFKFTPELFDKYKLEL